MSESQCDVLALLVFIRRAGEGGSQPGLETGPRHIPARRPQPDSSAKGEGQVAL